MNGKIKAKIMVATESSKEEIEKQALEAIDVSDYKKVIVIPNRLVNVVV